MIVPVAGVEKVECNVGLGTKAAREGLAIQALGAGRLRESRPGGLG
jgi:hypothetical protein